jgi:alpha-mannosidase
VAVKRARETGRIDRHNLLQSNIVQSIDVLSVFFLSGNADPQINISSLTNGSKSYILGLNYVWLLIKNLKKMKSWGAIRSALKKGRSMKGFKRNAALAAVTVAVAVVFNAPAYDLTKEKIVYEIPYAHLDMQWNWDLKKTIDEYLPLTLQTNFANFDKYPEYKFNFEGAYRYWIIKQTYPADFARLKHYVASGQWVVCGGGAESGDVNLPSAEALIRNYLVGNTFFRDEFGKTCDDIFLPDCFGFGYQLPTIAAHCGFIGFSSQKTDLWGGAIPSPFPIGRWIGVDGSSLIAALKPGPYSSGMDIRTFDGDWLKSNTGTPGIWATTDYIGVGDTGGCPAQDDITAMVNRMRANNSNDIKLYISASNQLYHDLTPAMAAALPSYDGELLMSTHGTGCYTSWAKMKYLNRKNEQRAMTAEFAGVTANWLGNGSFIYPKDTLWHAWLRVIACQFHDVLTGTSIPSAYSTYAIPMEDSSFSDFTYALSLANNAMANSAGQQLTTTVSEVGRAPLVLVNALAISRCDVVDATVNFGGIAPAGVKVYDPDGREVAAQITSVSGENVNIAFVATVPAASYSVFEVAPTAVANPASPNLRITATAAGSELENDFYLVTVNAKGDIAGLLDKRSNKQLLSAPSRLELRNDQGTGFPAWEILRQDVAAAPRSYVDEAVAMTITESGPARVSLRVVRTKEGSTFTQYIRLGGDSAGMRVDVDNTINWLTAGALLKASFPMTCANSQATWDIGVGTIQRGTMTDQNSLYEVPGQQWADQTAADGSYGMSILNDCKYGWNKASDNTINLTLIHSPLGGGHHYQGDLSSVTAVGAHNFTYSFYGHVGSWTNGTVGQAERLNQPIFAFQATPRAGANGKVISLLKTSTPQVTVMAIKKAEKSDNYIIRVRETTGNAITGATLIFPMTKIVSAAEVNGMEDVKGAAQFSGSDLTFNLTKYQPKAFSVKLGPIVAVMKGIQELIRYSGSEVMVNVRMTRGDRRQASFRVPAGATIRSIAVYNAIGKQLVELVKGDRFAGPTTIAWDGRGDGSRPVGAGLYFVTCVTDQGRFSARLMVTDR